MIKLVGCSPFGQSSDLEGAIGPDKKLVIPDYVIARHFGSETIILNLESGTYSGLDSMGARVWHLLTLGYGIPDVVSILLGEFDVTEERLAKDVRALIDGLITRGLVEVQT